MDLFAILDQVREQLAQRGRITYRMLRAQFKLDDGDLEALKEELIEGQQVAVDEGGKVLVWTGTSALSSLSFSRTAQPQTPVSYTPPHLAERIRAEQTALEARGATDGERKTITALFADLKGSTALIEGLDPEDARAIIDPALQLMMDAVHRYEGYVAQALGDGIFALFGAPLAHEDHPQRALYAALRMQDEMRRYGDQIRLKHSVPLAMRVGVNTGEVVVRSIRKDDLHTDYVPVGHSINLAARMEQMATPGAILVTEYTHRLTEGYFAFTALGAAEIKGVEAPLEVYEVLGLGPLRTKLQVAARRGLTRFIGRQGEVEQLQRALAQVKAGHGQIVGVMGEPGLGKSRLFYEFKRTAQSGCLVLEAYSVSHGKASSYLPLIELLKDYFQMQLQDDERTRRQKVIGKVLELDRHLEDTLPYLFALLGIEEQPSPLQQMDPQIRRRRTFDALKKLLLRESLTQPLLLVFEDLHWIDSETQGFLDMFSETVASTKILLLVNYRPEYCHEWGSKGYYTQLRLTPLGNAEAEEFLDVLLGATVGADLRVGPPEPGAHTGAPLRGLKRLILEKTEGTPFFMEEIIQALAEEGVLVGATGSYQLTHPAASLQTPPTVQGVLAARIDRLAPDEKALLQQLAVIGREFPLSLVRQVIPQPEEELYRGLSALQRKGFLYEQPTLPEVEYVFKHALTQEVAYGSLLQERRKALHERTAQAMETLYQAVLEDHYSNLAHHYSRSGNTQKAVDYLQHAGQQAVQRSANAEAISHFTTAIALLPTLSETRERTQQELTLHVLLGGPLIAAKGWGSPEVEAVYTRAHTLCRSVGETPQLFPVLWGLFVTYIILGKVLMAQELAEQLLRLAQKVQERGLLLWAHYAQGAILTWLGEFAPAYAHLRNIGPLYDTQQHPTHTLLYGQDPGAPCLAFEGWVLWFLGYSDQALQKTEEALALARGLGHPFTLAYVISFAALLRCFRGEARAAHEYTGELIPLCTAQGIPFWLAWGTLTQVRVQPESHQHAETIVQLREVLAAYQAAGGEVSRSYFLALLAECYGRAGQVEKGLRVLDEVLARMEIEGERFYQAEFYRLKGELTLQQESQRTTDNGQQEEAAYSRSLRPDAQGKAEACFRSAITIAEKQQAKSLELRAIMSLARLWQQQGIQQEAHKMLVEIYNWFTEGFDTKDLREAKELIEELSH